MICVGHIEPGISLYGAICIKQPLDEGPALLNRTKLINVRDKFLTRFLADELRHFPQQVFHLKSAVFIPVFTGDKIPGVGNGSKVWKTITTEELMKKQLARPCADGRTAYGYVIYPPGTGAGINSSSMHAFPTPVLPVERKLNLGRVMSQTAVDVQRAAPCQY